MNRPKGLFVLNPNLLDVIYGPEDRMLLRSMIDIPNRAFSPHEVRSNLSILKEVELLFSGWEGGRLDKVFLDAAPRLKAVFYGAGSVRELVTDEFWKRGIPLSSAACANAIPVAEFTLAEIILSLKRAWWNIRVLRQTRAYPSRYAKENEAAGTYRSTVGIVSLGMIGRHLRKMLKMLDVRVLAYDPYISREAASSLDVELVSIEELFERSDVVTIHTPWLKETERLITADLIGSMKPRATLINTSRGMVIDEPRMIDVMKKRPDLFAVLDVTCWEPLEATSPLYSLPNVILTPHIAGSMYGECRRMGNFMVDEARRFLNGEELRGAVSREKTAVSA